KDSDYSDEEELEQQEVEDDGDEVMYGDMWEEEDAIDKEGSEEEEDEDEGATSFQLQQRKLRASISEQEAELLAERPWHLQGTLHTYAGDRPENSLLEAVIDVDMATRAAPEVTEEHTKTLEEMIKDRIKEEKWDDVQPKHMELLAKDREDLSMEKSKEGLGELYAAEYMKQTMGVEPDDPQAGLKEEMKGLFTKLCAKLDALSSFHYTPKPVIAEVKVKSNVPAIAIEEVLPVTLTDAQALAPEEAYGKKRGRAAEFLEEMDQDERRRARGAKRTAKRKRRKHAEAEQKLVAKLKPGLGNKYAEKKMLDDLKAARNVVDGEDVLDGKEFSTSAKFFSNLQDQV
ncbi:unnamed protein product, partial [Chrysoparadoxa australica]